MGEAQEKPFRQIDSESLVKGILKDYDPKIFLAPTENARKRNDFINDIVNEVLPATSIKTGGTERRAPGPEQKSFLPDQASGRAEELLPRSSQLIPRTDQHQRDTSEIKFTRLERFDALEASQLLSNRPGEELPRLALKFEQHGLSLLKSEETSESSRHQIYVSNERSSPRVTHGATVYRSIQQAINSAPDNSVINVLPGKYSERITINRSNIVLKTDRANPAILDGSGKGSPEAVVSITSNVSNVAIKNFEIANYRGQSGILVDGSKIHNITIAGNNVHGASESEGIGVYGREGSGVRNLRVISNRIHDLDLRGQIEAMPINGNVTDFSIVGNSGYKLKNLFIDIIGGEGSSKTNDQPSRGTIAYNFADTISTRSNSDYSRAYSAAGIYSDGARSLNIYGNYIRNSDFGIEIAGENRTDSDDVKVHGNIIENSYAAWLKLGYVASVHNSEIKQNLIIGQTAIERSKVGNRVFVSDNATVGTRNQINMMPSSITRLIRP